MNINECKRTLHNKEVLEGKFAQVCPETNEVINVYGSLFHAAMYLIEHNHTKNKSTHGVYGNIRTTIKQEWKSYGYYWIPVESYVEVTWAPRPGSIETHKPRKPISECGKPVKLVIEDKGDKYCLYFKSRRSTVDFMIENFNLKIKRESLQQVITNHVDTDKTYRDCFKFYTPRDKLKESDYDSRCFWSNRIRQRNGGRLLKEGA